MERYIAVITVGVSGFLLMGWRLRSLYMTFTSDFPRRPYISSDPLSSKLVKRVCLCLAYDPLGVTEAEANAYCELFQVPYQQFVTAKEIGSLFSKCDLAIKGKKTPTSEQITAAGFMYGIRGVHDIGLGWRGHDRVFESARDRAGSYLESLYLPRYRPST